MKITTLAGKEIGATLAANGATWTIEGCAAEFGLITMKGEGDVLRTHIGDEKAAWLFFTGKAPVKTTPVCIRLTQSAINAMRQAEKEIANEKKRVEDAAFLAAFQQKYAKEYAKAIKMGENIACFSSQGYTSKRGDDFFESSTTYITPQGLIKVSSHSYRAD